LHGGFVMLLVKNSIEYDFFTKLNLINKIS